MRTPTVCLQDGASTQQGASHTSGSPAWAARAMSLMAGAKWFEAMQLVEAQGSRAAGTTAGAAAASGQAQKAQKQAEQPLQGADPLLPSCLALCQAKLGLPVTSASAAIPGPAGPSMHPLQHLSRALAANAGSAAARPNTVTARLQQRSADAQAVGHALAFLLHPATDQLPAGLLQEARQVLAGRAGGLSSSMAVQMAAGPSAPGGGPGGSSAAQQAGFAKRAQGSKALGQLVGLVGLGPVKEQLLALRDQVSSAYLPSDVRWLCC